jgi:uncharacterized protein YkwD
VILVTAAILTVQSSSMLQPSYAQLCPEGSPVDASGNCPTDAPPPAGDGETAQAPPADDGETAQAPPATTETPPPPATAPPATTETPPPPAASRPENNSIDTSNYPVYCAEPCTVESNSTGNSNYPVYCASCNMDIYTGGGDLASMILAGHNRVRAQVGVAPLVWNDSLAASAQTWADHLAATNQWYHDPNPSRTWGEGISVRGGVTPDVPRAHMQEFFFSEMNHYHGQAEGSGGPVVGHYTQAVWNSTTSIGCATASNANAEVLVCRYNPPGNFYGQTPY